MWREGDNNNSRYSCLRSWW